MTCGYLLVPENRSKTDGRFIKLSIVIFEPDRERHEPVVYLTGGPGQPAQIRSADDIEAWWSFIDNGAWLRGRRLIVFDQRGVGMSAPSLSCAEHYNPQIWSGVVAHPGDVIDFDEAQKREIRACRDDLLAKGIDLTAYNTKENAADVHDLQLALNVKKWVLFGISYGTKLALKVLEDHPDKIAAVVLDSTLPLDVNYVDQDAANFDRVLKRLDADCAANADCFHRMGSLKTLVSEIVQQLDVQPVLLRLKGDDQSTSFTSVSGDDFIELLFNQFYEREAIETLPQLIRRTADQDYRPLAEILGYEHSYDDSSTFSNGMHMSVVCSDGLPLAESSARFPLLGNWAKDNFYDWACPLWPSAKAVKVHKSHKQNEVPVLFLSGEYDPATPSVWAESVARDMGRSQLVLFHGVGHDVIDTTECGGEVVSDFLENPDAKIKTPCLADMASPQFILPGNSGATVLTTVSTLPMLHR